MDLTVPVVMAEYFRMFAYAVVIVTVPFELKNGRHYNPVLFVGDVFFAVLAFISIPFAQVTHQPEVARLIFITPSTIIWAVAHVINLSYNGHEREKKKVKRLWKKQ